MAVDLRFQGAYTPPVGHVELNFGQGGGDPELDRELRIEATLRRPVVHIEARPGQYGTIAITLGRPTIQAAADYDINVHRGPAGEATTRWSADTPRQARAIGTAWQEGAVLRAVTRTPWEDGKRLEARPIAAPIVSVPRLERAHGDRWEEALPVDTTKGDRYTSPPRAELSRQGRWEEARPTRTSAGDRYTHPPRAEARQGLRYEYQRALLDVESRQPFTFPPRLSKRWGAPWEEAIWPPFGRTQPPEPPIDPIPEPWEWDGVLNFRCPLPTAPWVLNFAIDPCPPPPDDDTIIVPTRRVYIVLNSAELIRVSDNANIPAQQIALSIDAGSWAWQLQATLAGSDALDLIHDAGGAPVEIEARINGFAWRAVVDAWSYSRSFGRSNITLRASSLAAYLASPYAMPRSYTEDNIRLAQQLAAQELPNGWDLDWQLEDWTVPAGAWSYQDKTPIEAISIIAAAAGGYVQAHPTDPTIHVLPGYPTPPWQWASATPDYQLPLAVLTELGQEIKPIAPANAIYVSGRDQGVLARVRRDGTAGDQVLPTIVDPLITDVAAARQRGIKELGATGLQSVERLALPLSADLAGLIVPGKLVEVTGDAGGAWRGLVRAVSVSANRQNALRVTQQIEVERHHEEEEAA